MKNNPRDTHFKDFAKLLIRELEEKHGLRLNIAHDEIETRIARRAYDLADEIIHSIHVDIGKELEEKYPTPDTCISRVTMNELPIECACGELGWTNPQTGSNLLVNWAKLLRKFG